MSAYEQINVTLVDRVCTIALNRPDKLNAWTPQMAVEVSQAIGAAGHDPECRVIVLTGTGRGFCAGADMGNLQSTANRAAGAENDSPSTRTPDPVGVDFSAAPGPDTTQDFPGRFGYFFACPKPIIAAINGPCAGIGLILTLYADLRFTTKDAKFTTAFSARGLVAEHGVSWLLPRLIGEAHAMDLLLSSRKFTGIEAEELGLVNRALQAEDLAGHVAALARQLAYDVSPRSMAVMKRQVRSAYHQSFAVSLALADAEMQESFGTPDFQEGIASYTERRAPDFPAL